MSGETGVATNPPPLEFVTAMNASITQFVDATIREDDRGGLIAVTTKAGVNLAVVQRVGKKSEIVAYIGKKWDEPIDGGIYWRSRW